MTLLDPQRLQDLVPGLLGGLVTGLYHFAAVVMAGGSPTRAEYLRLALNMAMAVIVGAIFAYFLTSMVQAAMPWAPLKDGAAIGFGLGLLSWELLPLLYLAARNRAQREADRQAKSGQGAAP
jgi:hypothetical protein